MTPPTQPHPSKQRIEHFSIDPPDAKTPLVFPYKPLKGRASNKQFEDAYASKPLDILPRALIPRSWLPMKPPILHFGLDVDEDAIIAYALKRNCVVRLSQLEQEDPDPMPVYDDDEEEEGEHKPWYDGTDPRWPDVALDCTISCAIEAAMKEIHLCGPDGIPKFAIGSSGHRGHEMIVSLFTNYELNQTLPSREQVGRLVETLGLKTQPKWFLDIMEMWWRRG